MKKLFLLGSVSALVPTFVFATEFANDSRVYQIFGVLNNILSWVIPLLITLAVVYFIWGVIQYTLSTDEEKKKTAKTAIISGLIGLFIIVAFWGIIRFFSDTIGIGPEQINQEAVPCIPSQFVDCTIPVN